MASNIDPSKPSGPVAYTLDVRTNFAAAKAEIELLQLEVANGGGGGGGGTIGGPLNLWGTPNPVNNYDAQISATGGATLPGNDGQGELNYLAGRHIFKGYDGTTQFRVSNVPWAWEWWEAIGGSMGTGATLRAGSDLNPDCDGVIQMQGHGQLTIGNGEGSIAVFDNINQQIINYLQFVPGGHNQGIAIKAAGGEGLAVSITLAANYNGAVVASNNNGPLAVIQDPTTAGIARTTYLTFTAGSSGHNPKIGLASAGSTTDDNITVQALGGGSINFINDNGPIAVISDPAAGGVARTSYLLITGGSSGTLPGIAVTAGGVPSPPSAAPFSINALGNASVILGNNNGPSLVAGDGGGVAAPRTSYLVFQAGVSGVSPSLNLSTSGIPSPPASDSLLMGAVGAGGFILQNNNGRLFVASDGQPVGTPSAAYLRCTTPTGGGALAISVSAGTSSNNALNLQSLGTGEVSFTTGGGKQARVLDVVSAARTVDIAGAVNGGSPIIRASNGNLFLGQSGLATTATEGFIQIPTCAGPPTGVPSNNASGATVVVDNVDNRLCLYVNGTWRTVQMT